MRKVILMTISLMIFSSIGYGSDWKYIFTAPTGGEWFYDTQSITHGDNTIVVWTKWVLSDQERAEFIKKFPKDFKEKESMDIHGQKIIRTTGEHIYIGCIFQKEEINCLKNEARIISMSLYDIGNEIICFSGDQEENKFEDVFPDSKGGTLIEAICKEGEGYK